MDRAERRDWMSPRFVHLALLSLALLSWSVADAIVGGNGFIAAFTGGLAVRLGRRDAGEHLLEFAESWGQLLNLGVLFLFGGLMVPSLLRVDGRVLLYAVASLTVVRMLPVSLAMHGTGLDRASVLFLGWFGPRGLSSIVLSLVFLEEAARLASSSLVLQLVGTTVLLSIFAHELSARPLTARYARRIARLPAEAPERRGAGEPIPEKARPVVAS